MSSSPIAAFAAGLRRRSATRAITRCPCGPQAKAAEAQATTNIEQAPSRAARVAIIGATSLDGRIDTGGLANRFHSHMEQFLQLFVGHIASPPPFSPATRLGATRIGESAGKLGGFITAHETGL